MNVILTEVYNKKCLPSSIIIINTDEVKHVVIKNLLETRKAFSSHELINFKLFHKFNNMIKGYSPVFHKSTQYPLEIHKYAVYYNDH